MEKRTITLNLSEKEMNALEQLCEKKDMSKTSVLKQSLRLYQMVEIRIERGEKIFFESDKKEKMELVLI